MTSPAAAPRPRRARRIRGLAAFAAALLLPCLLTVPTARAHTPAGSSEEPRPPARMSTVGGERLGRPGVQVALRPGTPRLPKPLTSRAWIVADAESGEVLAAKNAHWRLAPASTIKMLLAETLLPKFDPDTVHRVTREDLEGIGPGSSLVGVKEGLTYTVRDLWLGVFLRSGNDAVHVLASMNGGKERTVREMNARARELGAYDTRVVSPDGYDAEGQVSSAYDLTLIARAGMQRPEFRKYAATVRTEFPGEFEKGGDGKRTRETFEIQNTNRLLTGDYGLEPYEGLAGVKNGYTSEAGFTFTGVAQRGERVLLVTVLHPEGGPLEVYKEAAELLDWGFSAAGRVDPVGELIPPAGARDTGGAQRGKNPDDRPGRTAGASDPAGSEGAAGATGTAAAGRGPAGGADTALAVAVVALAVVGAGVYAVHRRWPGRHP